MRTYEELLTFGSFEERFNYLKLDGRVGTETFGFDRYLNQLFYRSKEWHQVRDAVIIRDMGCDLACSERAPTDINGIYAPRIIVHHMNPIMRSDFLNDIDLSKLLDPNYLITTWDLTHRALHYGDSSIVCSDPIQRTPNDTCPWKL